MFQSYNLIPHQNVLSNVELALTLSGVSKKDRRRRAKEALIKVGLGDQFKKKPNQLSGGQMQRVAIARALVNNPDILLADEPTGALDTETSSQVLDILSEIASDKLVIMVTHNPELAQIYSTRIIRLLDGRIISDSMPMTGDASASGAAAEQTAAAEGRKQNGSSEQESASPAIWSVNTDREIARYGEEAVKSYNKPAAVVNERADETDESSLSPKERKALAKKRAKAEKAALKAKRPPKTSMKRHTALALSLNNLMTKKGRTFLTAFAGSIGIIGIALILSLSNGVQEYIDTVQEDTLSSYPVSIQRQTLDMTTVMTSLQKEAMNKADHEEGRIYTNQIMTSMMKLMANEVSNNNLTSFRQFIENNRDRFDPLTSDISYLYSTTLNLYRSDIENGIYQVSPGKVFDSFGMGRGSGMGGISLINTECFQRLINNDDLLKEQYSVIAGRFPEKYNEVVLIVSDNYEATDYTFYTLGVMDVTELRSAFGKMIAGEDATLPETKSYTYDELMNLSFKLMLNTDYFEKQPNGTWVDRSDDEIYLTKKLSEAEEIRIVGILKTESSAAMSNFSGIIGYKTGLMEHLINRVNDSEIVKAQKEKEDIDVFSGLPFETDDNKQVLTMEVLQGFIMSLPEDQQSEYMTAIQQMKDYGMDEDRILETFSSMMPATTTDATYDGNLRKLGVSDLESPQTINIYPVDFESKDKIMSLVDEFNEKLPEEEKITVSDYVGLIMNSVTTIINAISYILIAFVAISLIVSSIMIGIITYISVLERTKEIGILRAIGASKKDISRVFNAETLIVGFTAGLLGIVIARLMLIPINAIIYKFTDIRNLAVMPPIAAGILVLISMLLTFIAGLFPSRIAAKKDPVVALRTE